MDYTTKIHSNGAVEKKSSIFLNDDNLNSLRVIYSEKYWRDAELKSTDFIVPITDHPQHAAYMTYRQELRDYPAQEDFPNGQRPIKP